MDEILHAEATDEGTVRVRVNGNVAMIDTIIARQLQRDLDAALCHLGVERHTSAKKAEVQRFEEVEYVDDMIADRLSDEYRTVKEAAAATMSDLMLIDGIGTESARRIQDGLNR